MSALLALLLIACMVLMACSPAQESVPSEEERTLPTLPADDSTFSVRYIDVGQADAALVECDGRYMLIDGGNKGDSDVIYTVLNNGGIELLDIVVASHVHEDHIGGLPAALVRADADLILCPTAEYDSDEFMDFRKYALQRCPKITVPQPGDTYVLGSATVTVLGVNSADSINDTSIVLKVQYGETSFLFTGDAEEPAEQAIMGSGQDLSATVLKVGHHGSSTSSTAKFLDAVDPGYAVISVGKNNSYGHPAEETLQKLADRSIQVYRTDQMGDILCTSDGQTVSFTWEKSGTAAVPVTAAPIVVTNPVAGGEAGSAAEAPAAEITYVLNTNTRKFHLPSCKSVAQIKESNRSEFTGTRDEIIEQGYSPCGNCRP
ncbi:MAG: MBL fold metallo-hydrolase [Firmicutes bacterium]|nr:MBL fold metallo-hydrolase [Bacillota bacterium]